MYKRFKIAGTDNMSETNEGETWNETHVGAGDQDTLNYGQPLGAIESVAECEAAEGAPAHGVRKVFKSSVVLVPPQAVWDQIQAIREKHDSGFVRWMPHVNLVYPFLQDDDDGKTFEEAASRFSSALSTMRPFVVKFTKDSFCYFIHKKKCTLWLKPIEASGVNTPTTETVLESGDGGEPEATVTNSAMEDVSSVVKTDVQQGEEEARESASVADDVSGILPTELVEEEGASGHTVRIRKQKLSKAEKKALKKENQPQAPDPGVPHVDVMRLQGTLESVYTFCDDVSRISDRGFMPHLSLGQFSLQEVGSYLDQFRDAWSDMEFQVEEVHLISRDDYDDPFHVRHSVPLGKT